MYKRGAGSYASRRQTNFRLQATLPSCRSLSSGAPGLSGKVSGLKGKKKSRAATNHSRVPLRKSSGCSILRRRGCTNLFISNGRVAPKRSPPRSPYRAARC